MGCIETVGAGEMVGGIVVGLAVGLTSDSVSALDPVNGEKLTRVIVPPCSAMTKCIGQPPKK